MRSALTQAVKVIEVPKVSVRATFLKVTSGQLRFLGLLFGVGNLPDGKRKQALNHALNELFDLFDGRVLPFDIVAARRYAELAVRARNIGKGLPTPDGYIAAIAAAKGFLVATRDTSPFEAAGVTVLNPWTSAC